MSHKLAKTNGLSKLYDFLDGYEHAGYTGASKSESLKSMAELFKDEVTILIGDEYTSHSSINRIIERIDLYLTGFFNYMKSSQRPNQIKWLADNAKTDSKMLSDLVSFIMSQSSATECYYFLPFTGKNIGKYQFDISEKCPKYVNKKCRFCLISLYEESDDNASITCEQKLDYTKHLVKAVLELLNFLLVEIKVPPRELSQYQMLFQHILTSSKIFELMNPTGNVREDMILGAKELLEREPLDNTSEDYSHWKTVLYSVFEDIRSSKLPYVADIQNALRKTRSFIDTPYDYEYDTYMSLKGSGQSKFTHQKESLLSSIYEVDLFKDLPEFQEFDKKVGYESPYRAVCGEELGKDNMYCIRTIMINNPGKFKGRIIHIFDNPIQDRCNYIHRRASAILQELDSDCTKNQEKGREFARRASLEWSLASIDKKPGIYGFDFSNATDTFDQGFQWEVLNFIFGSEIANFWDRVSKLRKFIQHSDGTYEEYQQLCGQPQGGLSSFDDFALGHHFIFLMDMKVCHMEDKRAHDVYVVLGDDSLAKVESEFDVYDPNHELRYDPNDPYNRSDFEYTHFRICNEFAGFIINYDKSHSVHFDSIEAKVDFAKVTFWNGQFFSPIPFRLAMRYSNSFEDRLAVAIWRGARGDSNARSFMDLVIKDQDPVVQDLIHCGQMDYLEPFKTMEPFNDSWLARVRYSYALSVISSTLGFLTLNDVKRDWATLDTWKVSMRKLFNRHLEADLNELNSNHKALLAFEQNYYVVNMLKTIYNEQEADDKFLALVLGTAEKQLVTGNMIDVLEQLYNTSKLVRLAKSNPDVDISEIFPDFNKSDMSNLRSISNATLTRGINKRPRETVIMFSIMRDTLKELDGVLGECPHKYMVG